MNLYNNIIDLFNMVSEYIDNRYKKTNNYRIALHYLNNLEKFIINLNLDNSTMTSLSYELIKNNKVLREILKTIVLNDLDVIKSKMYDVWLLGRFSINLIKIYCEINKIDINGDSCKNNDDLITLYLRELPKNFLSFEEERDLFFKMRNGDLVARKKLIEYNLRIVVNMAKKYINRGISFSDIIQEGNLALLKALDKYDPNYYFRFYIYVEQYVQVAIDRALVKTSYNNILSRRMYERKIKYYGAQVTLMEELKRMPTNDEIAQYLHLSLKDLKYLLNLPLEIMSIDDENSDLGSSSDVVIEVMDKICIEQIINILESDYLSESEKKMIQLRFGFEQEPKTMEEIAGILKLNVHKTKKMIYGILNKIKKCILEDNIQSDNISHPKTLSKIK